MLKKSYCLGLLTLACLAGFLFVCPEVKAAVTVNSAEALENAIADADAGGDKTILVADGTYTLSDMLWVEADGVTVKSASGDRDQVTLRGNGMTGDVSHIFNVNGNDFTVQDMTLRDVANHAVQLQVDVDGARLSNLHILDTYEQMIKVSYDAGQMSRQSENGVLEDCLLEYSAGVGPQYYIGGIDAHNAKNWTVRRNTFKNIASPSDSEAEHAVHFWSDSEGTLVERNLIINSDRGIGFGLGDRGHSGGVIRNNMIFHNTSGNFADVGISLESASGAEVYNNTVFQEHAYDNAIEYRFGDTSDVLIANNLTNKPITSRDGGSADLTHNVTDAGSGWFVDPGAGNLRLSSSISQVVNQGIEIAGLTDDFDGHIRPYNGGYDIGANEYGSTSPDTPHSTGPGPKIIATSGPGETTKLRAYDPHGNDQFDEVAGLFPAAYLGGAGVVSLDANNNGVKDQVVVFARSNGGPQARVFSVKSDGSLPFLGQMFVFDSNIRDGLSMTAGDFDNDGFDDDVAACLTGDRAPEVRVYKNARGVDNWERIGRFNAPFGSVGCNLGTFQYDDKADEILVGPNHGPADPVVYIYTVGGTLKKQFPVYGPGVISGVTPSGIGGRIYTTPNNGSSHVRVFDKNGEPKNFWWVYARHVRGDFINVAGDIDRDGVDEILTAPIGSNGPHILSFEPSGKARTFPRFFAFDEYKRNGVGIAVIENWYGVE
ncbi:hypothetical protein ACFL2B_01025 [Patescibacteria group bacterium]